MMSARFSLDGAWQLHPQVSLRPEPFGALLYHFGTRRLSFLKHPTVVTVVTTLADHDSGLLACTAAGVTPAELPAYERALATLAASQRLVDYATAHHVGVKFSTNGVKIDADVARRLAGSDYIDVQISLDGATATVNDAVRGDGSYATALRAMEHLAAAGFAGFKISVVVTRHNVGQLDEFKAMADRYGAQLRITRLRPSGRGADVWDELHPTGLQQRQLYDWLVAHGEQVLTGDSFFHLSAYGEPLPGLNLCGAGRVVCLIDPVGDVYACPFAIHESFLAGNVRGPGGFAAVWRDSELFAELRRPQTGGACNACQHYDSCRGGCMAAKFFTGLPLDGPDPECVRGFGETALATVDAGSAPRPAADHSHGRRAGAVAGSVAGGLPVSRSAGRPSTGPVPVTIGRRPPDPICDENPLAGFHAGTDSVSCWCRGSPTPSRSPGAPRRPGFSSGHMRPTSAGDEA